MIDRGHLFAATDKMQNPPLVSIIVPCYNQVNYLTDAIDSIAGQTYNNIEVVIVDDGSTDGSIDLIKSQLQRYQNKFVIKAFSIPNSGVAIARNVAIENSTGEFIVPLDADDMLHPEFVEQTLSAAIQNPEISIVYTNYKLFGDVSEVVKAEEYDYWKFLYEKNLFASTALIKKRAWYDARGYNPNMIWGFEDWEFWISCGAAGHFGKKIDKILFFYRKKKDSSTRNFDANANSKRLFARMALNHPNLYPLDRVEWAAREWASALTTIVESSDKYGIRYITGLTGEQLEQEALLLKKFNRDKETMTLYEIWLRKSPASFNQQIKFNLGLMLEKTNQYGKSKLIFEECKRDQAYQTASELALRRLKSKLD